MLSVGHHSEVKSRFLPLPQLTLENKHERDCVVKLVDNHGAEHSVKVRAESVYEAALKGLRESNDSIISHVEVWEGNRWRFSLFSKAAI